MTVYSRRRNTRLLRCFSVITIPVILFPLFIPYHIKNAVFCCYNSPISTVTFPVLFRCRRTVDMITVASRQIRCKQISGIILIITPVSVKRITVIAILRNDSVQRYIRQRKIAPHQMRMFTHILDPVFIRHFIIFLWIKS